MKKVRVLLLLDEAWNDYLYGNNNMTNWFSDIDAVELATVYCSPEMPSNSCCNQYFQVSDQMMLRSILRGEKAGRVLSDSEWKECKVPIDAGISSIGTRNLFRTEFFRFCRDILWLSGQYDKEKLKQFVNEFSPDIIFSQRRGSVKICRLERILVEISGCPLISFTGDNEYSLLPFTFSPFAWIRRFMVRRALKKNIPMNSLYYTMSTEQAEFYTKKFGIPTKLLFKCADYSPERIHTKPNSPIRVVYIGKLYCGRWKTLAMLANEIRKINNSEKKIVLDIYTRDKLSNKQIKLLNDGKNVFIKGACKPNEIQSIYDDSDIALHVESFDYRNRIITQHSFSTKIIDCLSSGCAVMAIGWEKHSACIELKRNDAAFVISDPKACHTALKTIVEQPTLILEYAEKAMEYIRIEHNKTEIHAMLKSDFSGCIGEKK